MITILSSALFDSAIYLVTLVEKYHYTEIRLKRNVFNRHLNSDHVRFRQYQNLLQIKRLNVTHTKAKVPWICVLITGLMVILPCNVPLWIARCF